MYKYTNWSNKTKGIICGIIAALGLVGMVSGDPEQTNSNNVLVTIETQAETESETEFEVIIETESYSEIESEIITESIEPESTEDTDAEVSESVEAPESTSAEPSISSTEPSVAAEPSAPTVSPAVTQSETIAPVTEVIVYVTNTGDKYHESGCRHLKNSKIEISLDSAVKNYEPCGVCKPPVK